MSDDLTVTRKVNGIEVSTIYKGYRRHKLYIDYTVKEAKQKFKEYLKTL